MLNRRWTWEAPKWKSDLPSSMVVFFVALPLCMGVAIASGAPVTAGLVAGMVGGLVVGTLAGSPMQVSGPAAGLTVLVYEIIQRQGLEELGVIVLAAGALQLLAGLLHVGQWFRAVSPAVIRGMLAGIGVLIAASQFHVMVDDKPKSHGWENLVTIPQAIQKSFTGFYIGSGRERQEKLDRLRELAAIHLRQNEIAEQLHHLLAGREARGKKAPQDLEGELRKLGRRQEEVVKVLKRLPHASSTAGWDQAVQAAENALRDLAAARVPAAKDSVDAAERQLRELLASHKNHNLAAMVGIATILIIVGWQAGPARRLPSVPSAMVALCVTTAACYWLRLPVLYVEVPENLLEEVFVPSTFELATLLRLGILFSAVQVAIIASAETLLCSTAVDKLHDGPRTQYDRELIAQGVGNMCCGLLNALPVTGVIVRSSANVYAGAKTRWSAVLHGVWLLVFVSLLTPVLRLVPTSSLAALLVYTGYKLVVPKHWSDLVKEGRWELAIYLTTVVTIVATDLLTGVAAGIALSVIRLAVVFSRLEVQVEHQPDHRRMTVHLLGSATFLRLPKLAEVLEDVPDGTEVIVDVEHLDYMDVACKELLHDWETQNRSRGCRLVFDRDSMMARFWRRPPGHPTHVLSPRRQRQSPL